MYVYAVERLKQMLGLGFAGSDMGVIEAIESMCKTMAEVKTALGLLPNADAQQILAAIEALQEKEPVAAPEVAPPAAEKAGWFRSLFKS
jgi:hypothetical protein